jgi:molybdate transport system substrate-binding protein
VRIVLSSVIAAALVAGAPANAAEVTLIAPGAIRAAIVQMIPGFEKKTGHTVKVTFGSGGSTRAQVTKGVAFDVSILQPPFPEVTASGNVVNSTETTLAHVAVGVAVRTGQPHPKIATPDDVKALLLNAMAISYPDPRGGAGAGTSVEETLKRLGLSDEIRPKVRLAPPGAGAMKMLADSEVDVGITFISEIVSEKGVEVVGPLPESISTPTRLVGFIGAKATDPAAAKELLSYLSGPEAAKVYEERGLVAGTGASSDQN